MITGPERQDQAVAAVCKGRGKTPCPWYVSAADDEEEMAREAEEHARAAPGHLIVCQVRLTRTWHVTEPTPEDLAARVAGAVQPPGSPLIPPTTRRGGPVANLTGANTARAATAGARNAARAAAVLAAAPGMPARWRQVLQLRIAYPEESWSQLGARLGVTRYVVASVWRRAVLLVTDG